MTSPVYDAPALIIEPTGQVFPLSEERTSIGRKSGNTIVLEGDLKVSRHHATISQQSGTYIIQDVGSSNGTYVNGQRLTAPQTLSNEDTIRIGSTILTVRLLPPETEPRLKQSLPAATEAGTPGSRSPGEDTAVPLAGIGRLSTSTNPYVGPRTFSQEESDRFFGREAESNELLSLIISERLVLFYAESGAGKSSLINARIIPQLRRSGFPVLPVGRVSGALPEGIANVANVYIFNLLLSLDESDGDPRRFTEMTLTHYLARLTSLDGIHYYYDDTSNEGEPLLSDEEFEPSPYVLIIDQFEELITSFPERWDEREGFFRQLEQSMTDDPFLWVVLVLREDYVAALDPYLSLVPGHLRARFYMQRMGPDAALKAIQMPAENYGRPFAPGAAESLVDNLRQIRTHPSMAVRQTEIHLGQFVEPVQLQVVCFQLWENLQARPPGPITRQDLEELGNVDKALGDFYEQALSEVIRKTGITEIDLRNFFTEQLITEAGTRGTVYRGNEETGGIPNQAVELLASHFLLRSDVRTGGTWYELVHDRFIEPIRQSNRRWRERQPLLQAAKSWLDAGRSNSQLLEGQLLQEALAGNWRGLGPLVQEFLEASQATQRVREEALEKEKEAQHQRELEAALSLRRRAWLLSIVSIAAVIMALTAVVFGVQSNLYFERAIAAGQTAQTRLWEAATARAGENIAQETATAGLAEADQKQQQADSAAAEAQQLQELLDTQKGTAVAATASYLATQAAQVAATLAAQENPLPPPPITLTTTTTPTGSYTGNDPRAATATTGALQMELAKIQAEQTAVARCPFGIPDDLRPLWEQLHETYRERLVCPDQASPTGGYFAEQPFENGYMFWSQIRDIFIVTIKDEAAENTGVWHFFSKEDVDSFDPNPDGVACEADVPRRLVQPVRGFGAIWCANPAIREQIGFGTQPEFGVTSGDLYWKFKGGAIVRGNENSIYLLFADDGTYVRLK